MHGFGLIREKGVSLFALHHSIVQEFPSFPLCDHPHHNKVSLPPAPYPTVCNPPSPLPATLPPLYRFVSYKRQFTYTLQRVKDQVNKVPLACSSTHDCLAKYYSV